MVPIDPACVRIIHSDLVTMSLVTQMPELGHEDPLNFGVTSCMVASLTLLDELLPYFRSPVVRSVQFQISY